MAGSSSKNHPVIDYWDANEEQHRPYELVTDPERNELAHHDKVIQALDLERSILICIGQEMQEELVKLEGRLKSANREVKKLRRQLKDKDECVVAWMMKDHQNFKKVRLENEITQGGLKRKRTGEASASVTKKGKIPKICNFCKKSGHIEIECWKKSGRCFMCGSPEHQVKDCPSKSGKVKVQD